MFTALRATSLTIRNFLQRELAVAIPDFFDAMSGGTMVVSISTPQEMPGNQQEGLSVWLYRVQRDDERLNAPPERVSPTQLRRTPLPVRLHYLMTPVVDPQLSNGVEVKHAVVGKVLQAFHDRPLLSGAELSDDFAGTTVELAVRLETMSLEEYARVWDALEGAYQLSLSYEVSVVYIHSARELEEVTPVTVVTPEFGAIVGP